MLRKYVHDPSHVVNYVALEVNKDLTYEETTMRILGRKAQTLRNGNISLVLIQWSRHGKEEATWDREGEILAKYPDVLK